MVQIGFTKDYQKRVKNQYICTQIIITMETTAITLTETWVELADGDYFFQNIDASQIALLSYGDSAPTGTDGAIRVYKKDKGFVSAYASGKVWGRSLVGECKISLTK
jgi:fibronectin type 3 domain-containing protein